MPGTKDALIGGGLLLLGSVIGVVVALYQPADEPAAAVAGEQPGAAGEQPPAPRGGVEVPEAGGIEVPQAGGEPAPAGAPTDPWSGGGGR
ncbi:MAG: hypothetical protein KatS3mg102_1417 [Planctomycetota bacterium]|nr:MAG: hypothetical protein KatS3mg102_1417 [Planctomycetota bacterium]